MADRQTSTPRRSGDSGQRRPAPRDNAERRQPPRESAERRQRDSGERRQPPRDGTERRQPSRDTAERRQPPRDGAERRQPPRDSGDRRQSASYEQERRSASARSGGGDRDKRSSRRGDVIRCENCGEDYSVTYKRCPFCDERPGRGGISGRRVANTRGGGYGRPASTLKAVYWLASFAVILAAAFIIYRFIGAPIFGGKKPPDSGSQSSVSSQNPGGQSSADKSGAGNISDIPTPVVEGIALSENDLTLEAGASEQLTANLLPAGVSGDVTWSSSDTSSATVDITGLVTNVNSAGSTKKVTITATCGDVSAEAVVYCKATAGGSIPSSGKQGTIINAEKGLNIRSGPGTTYDKVASATNGSRVTVLGEENGWYKIIYSGNKTGYVSKDYVSIG